MKGVDYVCKVISKENNIDETQINLLIDFIFTDYIKSITDNEFHGMFLLNLGTFYIDFVKLQKKLRMLIHKMKAFKKKGTSKYLMSYEISKVEFKKLWTIYKRMVDEKVNTNKYTNVLLV